MLKLGDRAPEFTLPDHTGADQSLTALIGTGAGLLYFYPADFGPLCTRQARMLRDLQDKTQEAHITVIGVSPQSTWSHARFHHKHDLRHVLLCDRHKTVIAMYGVNGPLGIGVRRATFLIDSGLRIRDQVLADWRIGRHEDLVRKAIMMRLAASPVQ
jgi:peroxiredoxin Q/BCP